MKRFAIFIALSLLGINVFAKSWESNVCAGFTVPVSRIGVDQKGADDITQLSFGLEGFYLGRHENGFTVKGDYAIPLSAAISLKTKPAEIYGMSNFSLRSSAVVVVPVPANPPTVIIIIF